MKTVDEIRNEFDGFDDKTDEQIVDLLVRFAIQYEGSFEEFRDGFVYTRL